MLTNLFLRLVIRVTRFRKRLCEMLAEEIDEQIIERRRQRREERRARRRERRIHKQSCAKCAYFGGSECRSRNERGWCNKFEDANPCD